MQQQLDTAAVVVVVLSPEFLTRKAPLAEVRSILNKRKLHGAQKKICLVFHGITVEACCAMDGAGALTEYKADIHELCEVTGIREDKTRYYKGEQAVEAVNTLPGGAYAIDLSQLGEEATLAEQVAALLINQLGNMQGASELAASPSWDSLVSWLRSNDHAILFVLENAEMILPDILHIEELMKAERLAGLCHRNALLLTIIAALICSKRCSVEVAMADAESKGPLMLLEGARMGAARDHPQC
ncbi:hypothetical protein WJX72_000675 [[Myrmecia] bisecta]|uniref:Uncharacterized protein n=1 Tax=[Myrmecia] bisecta TaxID=41462 RepID=A0AAW1P681_9CHLO